ncbi:MAG: GTPase domain-containing protein [Treponema sp.]|nr:GTPase domain-containing protein [Treponema sp.]
MEEDIRCNIVTLGKTGVGKSSLLNYLFDTNFKAGAGKPVTGQDLYEVDAELNGQKIRVYDSWGIEADKVNEWKILLQKRFSEHGVEKDPSEWFHAVIYCVQAGGGRIENIDTQIISDFVKQGYRVVVALTKIDQLLNEDDRVTLKKTIESEVSKVSGKTGKITVISVCSEKKKKRMGESKPVGREDLIDAILAGWLDALKDRLPHSIVALLAKRLDGYAGELEKYIRNHEVSGRPEGNDELVGSCRRKIDARMESLLNKDLQEVSGLLITRCQRIGCALQNVFKVSTNDNMSHRAFNHFFGQNEASQGKRTAAYIASLGIYALYRSKSSKYRAAERQRITALITSDIEDQKKWLQEKLLPELEKHISGILGEGNV